MAQHEHHAHHGHRPEGKPKLTYFAGRGRAETTRLLFHDAGIEFDDVRLSDVTPLKPELLYGQVPLLEWGGVRLVQSVTIARFVARVTGHYGESAVEGAKIDQLLDGIIDHHAAAGAIRQHPEGSEERKKATEKFLAEAVPRFYGAFEKQIKASGGAFLLGQKLSLGDVALFNLLDNNKVNFPQINLDSYPALKKLAADVAARPKIAAWLAKRPNTPF